MIAAPDLHPLRSPSPFQQIRRGAQKSETSFRAIVLFHCACAVFKGLAVNDEHTFTGKHFRPSPNRSTGPCGPSTMLLSFAKSFESLAPQLDRIVLLSGVEC